MPRTLRSAAGPSQRQQPQQHFGVAAGREPLAARFERPPQLAVVVDLAVEHDVVPAVGRAPSAARRDGPGSMIASRRMDEHDVSSAERHTPRPSGPRCASAALSAADGSGSIAPSRRTTPAMPHMQKNRDFILISSFGRTLSFKSCRESRPILPLTSRPTLMRRSDPRSVNPPARTIACATVVPVSSTK